MSNIWCYLVYFIILGVEIRNYESNEGCAASIFEVEPMNMGSTSAVPPHYDQILEISHDTDQAGGKFVLNNVKSR